MKLTKFIFKIMCVLALFIGVKSVWSANLTLTRIGTLSTVGLTYSSWTITGESPDFSGTATPSSMVAVTVNAVTATTSAALNGVWTSRPTNIVTGSNSVSIASGNEVISFILNYTPALTPTTVVDAATTSALPASGIYTWPIIIVLAGVVVFIVGRQIGNRIEEEWNI